MDSNIIFPELPTYVGVLSVAGLLSVVLTVVLPVLAGLFMRANWSGSVRGLVLLAAAALKGFLEAWLVSADTNTAFNFGAAAYTVGVQFLMAVAIYFGYWRGTGVQQAALQGGVLRSKVVDGTVVP